MALYFHCLELHNKEMEVRSSRDSALVIDIACWNAYCIVWERLDFSISFGFASDELYKGLTD